MSVWCLEGVWMVSGRSLDGVWKVIGSFLDGVLEVWRSTWNLLSISFFITKLVWILDTQLDFDHWIPVFQSSRNKRETFTWNSSVDLLSLICYLGNICKYCKYGYCRIFIHVAVSVRIFRHVLVWVRILRMFLVSVQHYVYFMWLNISYQTNC